MSRFEETFIYLHKVPLSNLRYVDVTNFLTSFLTTLTRAISPQSLLFITGKMQLTTQTSISNICCREEATLFTQLFRKPIDKHTLLHRTSHHTKSKKRISQGLVFSVFIFILFQIWNSFSAFLWTLSCRVFLFFFRITDPFFSVSRTCYYRPLVISVDTNISDPSIILNCILNILHGVRKLQET